jgi:hypothetical protein
MSDSRSFRTFADLYPFHLGKHTYPMCGRLHFIVTAAAGADVLRSRERLGGGR